MADQTPSVGRMVHFVHGEAHVPAVITDPTFLVQEKGKPDWAGQALTVFPVGEPPFTTVAAHDAGGAPATWHWPEYVPAPTDVAGVVTAAELARSRGRAGQR